MVSKTQAIKDMFLNEFPPSGLIKYHRDEVSPFESFRESVWRSYGVVRSKSNSPDGVDFYDDELDIPEIDKFIKALPAD